jgi:hypothetical protein
VLNDHKTNPEIIFLSETSIVSKAFLTDTSRQVLEEMNGTPSLNARPVLFGSLLVGLALSCFFYLLPSLICKTTFHPFLATTFLMAALSAPIVTSILVTKSIKMSDL